MNDFADPDRSAGVELVTVLRVWARLDEQRRDLVREQYGLQAGVPLQALLDQVVLVDLLESVAELMPGTYDFADIASEARHVYHPFYGDGRAGGYGA